MMTTCSAPMPHLIKVCRSRRWSRDDAGDLVQHLCWFECQHQEVGTQDELVGRPGFTGAPHPSYI